MLAAALAALADMIEASRSSLLLEGPVPLGECFDVIVIVGEVGGLRPVLPDGEGDGITHPLFLLLLALLLLLLLLLPNEASSSSPPPSPASIIDEEDGSKRSSPSNSSK